MRVKMKARFGMTRLLMEGCGIKIFQWERDLLILREVCEDARDEKPKITHYGGYTEIYGTLFPVTENRKFEEVIIPQFELSYLCRSFTRNEKH